MDIVTQEKKNSKRYLPHTVSTKEGAVKLYRQTKDMDFVLRRYHISKASLMRWNRLYDGTKESLTPKSHRPHSQHPNAHTEEELTWIRNYHRRNPNISICELYGRLRQEKAYCRHPGSLYRVFVRLGYRQIVELINGIVKEIGKEKFAFTSNNPDPAMFEAIQEFAIEKVRFALDTDDKRVDGRGPRRDHNDRG